MSEQVNRYANMPIVLSFLGCMNVSVVRNTDFCHVHIEGMLVVYMPTECKVLWYFSRTNYFIFLDIHLNVF